MNEQINAFLAEAATLITPTQRLSRHLRYQFAKKQINDHKKAWQTPDVLPWTAWCKRTLQQSVLNHDDSLLLLNSLQQQWLWQKIISESNYSERLLQINATAKQASHAYQLCQEWALPIFPKGVYLSEDAFAFQAWARAYDAYKQNKQFIDESCLPDYLLKIIADNKIIFGRLVFYGFDDLTTQQ